MISFPPEAIGRSFSPRRRLTEINLAHRYVTRKLVRSRFLWKFLRTTSRRDNYSLPFQFPSSARRLSLIRSSAWLSRLTVSTLSFPRNVVYTIPFLSYLSEASRCPIEHNVSLDVQHVQAERPSAFDHQIVLNLRFACLKIQSCVTLLYTMCRTKF